MVKAILFDFWGTLVENGVWSPLKQVKTILNIRLPFPEYVVRLERAMMTRPFGALKDAFHSVCNEFNINCDQVTIEELIGMWNKSWMLAKPYEETEEVLTKLKKEYKLILVSNTDNIGVDKVLEKYNLRRFFDHIFLSYDVGLLKTDPSFFKKVLEESKIRAGECMMVGDSIQSDILAAEQVGMRAILVDRKNSREHQPKISNLREIEGIL
ncbi:HAD family hydrolase [Candidatus Woesearchaeota archaeon]|nr:HAD family hydrolase [Candidatus Woesearchaeota archaeon]